MDETKSFATWNYRVMEWEKDGERWRTIHEVHYDETGGLTAYAVNPASPMATDNEDIADIPAQFAEAASKPTLVAEQFPLSV